MPIAYQYDANGYYAGESEDYGLLPNNATYTAPKDKKGHIPRWTGKKWEQIENHKGETGYVDGEPFTIKDFGPYPDGWSETAPEPTQAEINEQRRAEILARLAEIDASSVRPLRAALQGDAAQADRDKLAALDTEAETLRAELTALSETSPGFPEAN